MDLRKTNPGLFESLEKIENLYKNLKPFGSPPFQNPNISMLELPEIEEKEALNPEAVRVGILHEISDQLEESKKQQEQLAIQQHKQTIKLNWIIIVISIAATMVGAYGAYQTHRSNQSEAKAEELSKRLDELHLRLEKIEERENEEAGTN